LDSVLTGSYLHVVLRYSVILATPISDTPIKMGCEGLVKFNDGFLTGFASEYELNINSVMIQLRFTLDSISRSEQVLKWLILSSFIITVVPPKECAQ
jgi:hypothetical protein